MKFLKLNKKLRLILYYLIPIIVISYLFVYKVDIDQLNDVISKISVYSILLGVILYGLIIFLKYKRLERFIRIKLNKEDFYFLVNYNFYLNILPFKTGELLLISFLKNKGKGIKSAIKEFMYLRFYDVLAIFLISLFIILINLNTIMGLFDINFFLLFFALLFISIVVGVLFIHKKILRLLSKIRIKVLLLTLVIWALQYSFGLIIFKELKVILPLNKILLGQTLNLVFSALPINTFVNIGIFELSWTLVFEKLGLSSSLSASSGLAAHLLIIIGMIIFTLFVYLIRVIWKIQRHEN